MKFLLSLLAIALFASAVSFAADNPALGQWDCVATASDADAHQVKFKLNLQEADGKLSGSLVMEDSGESLPLIDPKVDGNDLTFAVKVEDATYSAVLKIDGATISGKFSGDNGGGTITGNKKT
jgi:hypothetical protein